VNRDLQRGESEGNAWWEESRWDILLGRGGECGGKAEGTGRGGEFEKVFIVSSVKKITLDKQRLRRGRLNEKRKQGRL